MRYVPWGELGGQPNVVVDGYPTDGTVLTLSHWRGSGSPPELPGDLSTEIAFSYLDRPDLHVTADAATNNHFDEDGLCGIFALLEPDVARAHRALLIDVASAGDFGTYRDRAGLRIAFALGALADEDRSTLDPAVFAGSYPAVVGRLYAELLPRMSGYLEHPGRLEPLWAEEDARLARDEARVGSGAITIEDVPDIDLAVVRVGDGGDAPHAAAIHNATPRFRVLELRGQTYSVRYRYETWVLYRSRPTMARVDLAPLAERLNEVERNGRWTWDGNDDLEPRLSLDAGESSIEPETFADHVVGYLARS